MCILPFASQHNVFYGSHSTARPIDAQTTKRVIVLQKRETSHHTCEPPTTSIRCTINAVVKQPAERLPVPNAESPKERASHAVATPFLASFLGLAAVRVWMQSNYFGSYAQSDAGILTIVNQLFYGAAMLIGALIALRKPATKRAHATIAWVGCILMTASTLFLLVHVDFNVAWAFAAACVIGGIGGAFGGATWIAPYMRLDANRAILYAFLSLALGSAGGLALSFMDESAACVTSMFMPAISLLCYQRAMKADVDAGRPAQAPAKPVYDGEPRKTLFVFLGGFAIFGLALGISRGFPMGAPVELGVAGRLVHQLGVVAISLFIIWWACVAKKRLSFIFLWRIEIALVACGMLLLFALPTSAMPFAIGAVNIADTLMLGVMWVTLQDASRHCTTSALSLYGFAWAARVLARDAGRIAIIALGATGIANSAANIIIGIVVFALAMSMALLLSGNVPETRPLFADDNKQNNTVAEKSVAPRDNVTSSSQPRTASHNETDEHDAAQPADDAQRDADADECQMTNEEWLKQTFGLSNREAEVAALIAQGRSKTYIAEALYVTENTVRTHAKNAYAKLGIHSNQELIDIVRTREEAPRS